MVKVNVVSPEAHEKVSVKHSGDGGEQVKVDESVKGEGVMMSGPHAMVGVTASLTKNLGNYNSARVEVSLVHPSTPDDIDEVYEGVRAWVEERMNKLVEELDSQ